MASKFDDETKDGIKITYLRDGDGNIRRDAKGRLMQSYTWRYRDADGKSRQYTSRKLDDVRRKRNEIRQSLDAGTYVDPHKGKILVSEYVARWLETIKPVMDYSTWSTHETRARRHIFPRLGHLRMNQLTPDVIEGFQAYLCTGRSLTTARTYMTTLNKIIQSAVDKGILGTDPRKGVEKVKVEWCKKKIPFDEHEINAIKKTATDDLYRLIELLHGTGARISEALAFDLSQVDWTEGAETLHIDRQIGKAENGETVIKDVKGRAKGTRTVPLPTWAVKALKAQMEACPPLPVTMRWVHRDKTEQKITARLIFHDGHGNPLKYRELRERWNTVVEDAGVEPNGEEGRGFHRMRHTYAADLIRQGIDLYVVSRLMGHSTVRVTEQYYAHLRTETLEGARHALNALSPEPTAKHRHLIAVRTA